MVSVVVMKIQIKPRWWFWPAFYTYLFTCRLTDTDPDIDMLINAVPRGWVFRLAGGRWQGLNE